MLCTVACGWSLSKHTMDRLPVCYSTNNDTRRTCNL